MIAPYDSLRFNTLLKTNDPNIWVSSLSEHSINLENCAVGGKRLNCGKISNILVNMFTLRLALLTQSNIKWYSVSVLPQYIQSLSSSSGFGLTYLSRSTIRLCALILSLQISTLVLLSFMIFR